MEVPRSVFLRPRSISHELLRLVQTEISKVPHPAGCRKSTVEDLISMIKKLDTITHTCESVLVDINAQGEEVDAFKALEEAKNVLKWAEFLDFLETTPSDPDLLFRAHKQLEASQPIFAPDIALPFNLEFRRTNSVDVIAEVLAEHLNKTQKEKDTGEKVETCFMSMSSVLEWTIHATGQKSKGAKADEIVGLAIFDVKRLRQASNTTVFRVSDFLDFFTSQGKDELVSQEVHRWVQNCDEYVAIGESHDHGLVRWVTWEDLCSPTTSMVSACFRKAFTLGIYRNWVEEQHIELEKICQKVVDFGKLIGGPEDDLLPSLIESILKPGIQFWGYRTDSSNDIIHAKTWELFNELTLEKLSSLSI